MFCVLYIIQQPYYDLCHTVPFTGHFGIQLWKQSSEVHSRPSLLQISLPLLAVRVLLDTGWKEAPHVLKQCATTYNYTYITYM